MLCCFWLAERAKNALLQLHVWLAERAKKALLQLHFWLAEQHAIS